MTIKVYEVDAAEYRKLLEPFESVEEANDAGREFYREVRALRLKYGIPDVLVVQRRNVIDAGREGIRITTQHHGYEVHAPEMLRVASEQVARMIREASHVPTQREPEIAPKTEQPPAPPKPLRREFHPETFFGREMRLVQEIGKGPRYVMKDNVPGLNVMIYRSDQQWVACASINGDMVCGKYFGDPYVALADLCGSLARLKNSIGAVTGEG